MEKILEELIHYGLLYTVEELRAGVFDKGDLGFYIKDIEAIEWEDVDDAEQYTDHCIGLVREYFRLYFENN